MNYYIREQNIPRSNRVFTKKMHPKYKTSSENATAFILIKFFLVLTAFLLFLFHVVVPSTADSKISAKDLIKDLACSSCHSGLNIESEIIARNIDLSHAGLRYNPAYLFEYLQNPTKVRQHIRYSRMPNFSLDEKESLALVLFLEKQKYFKGEWRDFPSGMTKQSRELNDSELALIRTIIMDDLDCTKCHSLEGKGENLSIDLTTIGFRLNRGWVQKYLVAPYLFDGPMTTMPSYFFKLAANKENFDEILPKAAHTINSIVDFLHDLSKEKRRQLQISYEEAKKAYPEVTAQTGEKIFLSQNCVVCHKHNAIKPWPNTLAPDLSIENQRVTTKWLSAYLKNPKPVRPFGFYPGSGSRMPDFRLSDEEVAHLTEYFFSPQQAKIANSKKFKSRKLSAFAMEKAKTLLQTKLSCLGCHQLGSEGGKVGPNLSSLKSRLQPSFVYQMVQNPMEIAPGTIMPKVNMPQKTLDLIVNYLNQQENQIVDATYLSLVDNQPYLYSEKKKKYGMFMKYCAPCHGTRGDGNGYNAKYLPTAPSDHSDQAYMATRPDDTLFDGIFAGGYILNKSNFMPPWGYTLKNSEIRNLVSNLRDFCQCQGPAWSRDN